RLGGNTPIQVDVRIVAATNRDLRHAVATRQFREGLFFRLSVFPVIIPPLRDRASDIPKLAHYLVERACSEVGKKPLTLTPATVDALSAYSWPGNVREMQNAIERAVILSDGDTLEPRHLHLDSVTRATEIPDPWDSIDLTGSLEDATSRGVSEIERRKLARAIREAGSDRRVAADLLRINFKTLESKLREHGLYSAFRY